MSTRVSTSTQHVRHPLSGCLLDTWRHHRHVRNARVSRRRVRHVVHLRIKILLCRIPTLPRPPPLLVSAHEQEGLSSWTRTDTSDAWEFKQFFSWQSMPRRGAEKCLVCERKPVGTIVANRGICKRKAFARFRDLNLRVSNESHLFVAGKWHEYSVTYQLCNTCGPEGPALPTRSRHAHAADVSRIYLAPAGLLQIEFPLRESRSASLHPSTQRCDVRCADVAEWVYLVV